MDPQQRIVLIGATGRTGRRVLEHLDRAGAAVTAVGRQAARPDWLPTHVGWATADLDDAPALATALADADIVVSCAFAGFTANLLTALPARPVRLVLMGSVRRYLPVFDGDGRTVAEAEALFAASGRAGVMLHASMIFGMPDDRNVSRILGWARRWPRWLPLPVPLPGGGGRLVQPIHVDDVARAVVAAIERPEADGPPIVLAGPRPITYARMVRLCAAHAGRWAVPLPIPLGALALLLKLATRLGLKLPLSLEQLRRSTVDKQFDPADMIRRLAVEPMDFQAGLARTPV